MLQLYSGHPAGSVSNHRDDSGVSGFSMSWISYMIELRNDVSEERDKR